MCGIAGFVGPGTRDDLLRMTRCLADRGPDDEGFWEGDGLHLGHRRLSILDLECGAQPMWSVDGQRAIVFNGEIYNFAQLRKELEAAGQVFRTDHSDTEVLLAAHAVWGDAMVGRLNGMWAFVIYDKVKRRLFGSRDRFGKKPFYYHTRLPADCSRFLPSWIRCWSIPMCRAVFRPWPCANTSPTATCPHRWP